MNQRVAHCTKEWHNAGGYKLSGYIGTYYPDTTASRPLLIGGAKNNMYIFFEPESSKWMITDCKSKVNNSIGMLRTRNTFDDSAPPVATTWEAWNENDQRWYNQLWSEKGWVSMDGFHLDFMGS